jgi:hypothetical protein
MPIEVGPGRRLLTALTWPLGIALTSWSYLWRITPIHRRELDGTPNEDLPPPLPEGVADDDVQRLEHGTGPLFHRIYTAAIRDADVDAATLIADVKRDLNRLAPWGLARFRKVTGAEGGLEVGDEFLVHMPGPWDGPVRVVEVTPTSFRFATLARHLEAGQIEWRARDDGARLEFRITSWARPGDRLSAIAHDRLRMAKEVQLHMWSSVLEHAVSASGGTLDGGLEIVTRRVDPAALPGVDAGPQRAQRPAA